MQVTWDKLESAGLVRLEIVPDDSPDLSFLDQKEFSRYRQKGYDRANNDGVWGIVGQYRMDEDSDWMNADSVFGFIGDDWKGSGYDTDIERNTIQSWVKGKKSMCPHCHRPM
jgi:hypothetical protein